MAAVLEYKGILTYFRGRTLCLALTCWLRGTTSSTSGRTRALARKTGLLESTGTKLNVPVQGLIAHEVRHTVGAYSRPMRTSLGPPYQRCRTRCSSNLCAHTPRQHDHASPYDPPAGRYRSHSRIRTRTALLGGYGWTIPSILGPFLGRCVSLCASTPVPRTLVRSQKRALHLFCTNPLSLEVHSTPHGTVRPARMY